MALSTPLPAPNAACMAMLKLALISRPPHGECNSRTVTYVICEPCIDVKDASCVEVCPVDCIHTTDEANMYYIDPDECIDCGACVDPCPVDAIYLEDEVPAEWNAFTAVNANFFK